MDIIKRLDTIQKINPLKTNSTRVADVNSAARVSALLDSIEKIEIPKSPVLSVKIKNHTPKNDYQMFKNLNTTPDRFQTQIKTVLPEYAEGMARYNKAKREGTIPAPADIIDRMEFIEKELPAIRENRDDTKRDLESITDRGLRTFEKHELGADDKTYDEYLREVNALRYEISKNNNNEASERAVRKDLLSELNSSIAAQTDYNQYVEVGKAQDNIKLRIYNDAKNGKYERNPDFETSEIYMSPDEANAYAYLLGKYGEKSANRYYAEIEEDLKKRKASHDAELLQNEENKLKKFSGYTSSAIEGGLNRFATGVRQAFSVEEVPSSVAEYKSQALKEDLTGVSRVLYDIAETGANMAPSILLSAMTSGAASFLGASAKVAATAGKIAGGVSIFTSSKGNAYKEKLKEGYLPEQAEAYSTLVGASEACLQYFIGGISKLSGSSSAGTVAKNIVSIDNAFVRVALELGVSGFKEGTEEALQTVLEPMYSSLVFNEEYTPAEIEEVAYSWLLGFLTSGVFEGGEVISQVSRDAQVGKELRADSDTYGEDVTRAVVEEGLESAHDTDSFVLAQKAQQRLEQGKNVSNSSLGRLYRANVEAVNAENNNSASQKEAEKETTSIDTDPETHTPVQQKVIEEYQAAVDSELVDFVQKSILNKGSNSLKFDLKPVSPRATSDIMKITGVDTTGFKTVIEQRIAEHINDRHGSNGEQDHSMQDINDIGRMQYVIDNYDSMEHGGESRAYTEFRDGKDRRSQTVKYIKAVNGTYYVVEAVPNTAKKTAFITSAYMVKAKKGQEQSNPSVPKPDVNVQNVTASVPATPIISRPDTSVNTNPVGNMFETVLPKGDVLTKATVLPTGDELLRERRAGMAQTKLEATGILHGVDEKVISDVLELSTLLKRNVEFTYSKDKGDEGWYDRDNDVIYLNVNSSTFGKEHIGVIVHEITHSIETSPSYFKFHNEVIAKYSHSELEALQKMWIERNRLRGKTITLDEANREIVADYTRRNLFTSKDAINDLVSHDYTFGEWIKHQIDKVLSFLGNKNARERIFFTRARDYYANALAEADATRNIDAYKGESANADYDTDSQNITDVSSYQHSIASNKNDALNKFHIQLDNWDKETIGFSFVIGRTSPQLRQAGMPDKQIRWDASKIKSLLSKHNGMSIEVIKQIPDLLNNPIVIIDSKNDYNSKIVMGNLYDEHGKIVTAVLLLTPTSQKGNKLDLIKISSAQGRSHIESLFKKEDGTLVAVRFADKERIHDWLNVNRLQLPLRSFNLDSDNIISETEQKSNPQSKNNIEKNSHSYSDVYEEVENDAPTVASSPKVVQSFIDRAEMAESRELSKIFAIPSHHRKSATFSPLRTISEELLRDGNVSERTIQSTFDTLYDRGVEESGEYVQKYSEVNSSLAKMTIKLTGKENEIYKNKIKKFSKTFLSGTVQFSDTEGIPLSDAWSKLNEMAPELFPAYVKKSDARISRIFTHVIEHSRAERFIEAYSSDKGQREWKYGDYRAHVADMVIQLKQAYRYMSVPEYQRDASQNIDRVIDISDGTEIEVPKTTDEAIKLYEEARAAKSKLDRVRLEFLWTNSDKMQLGRLLRGEIELSDLNPDKDNVEAIEKILPLKKEHEKYAKALRAYKEHNNARRNAEADRVLKTMNLFHDKKAGFLYNRETAERNIRDVVKDKTLSDEIISIYFTPIHKAEADKTRYCNALVDRVKDLNLSRKVLKGNTVSEAAAVQIYGEATGSLKYLSENPEEDAKREGKTAAEWEKVISDLWAQNPLLDKAKIENAVEEFRAIYNALFEKLNEARVRNGYEPISYRAGYFPHFKAGAENLLQSFASSMGLDLSVDVLPTEINGRTHLFRPGTTWFSHAQKRQGTETSYDALEGFAKYLKGAADVIYHTDNIQRLRALARRIRYNTTDPAVKERIDEIRSREDLSLSEKDIAIENELKESKYRLSEFVAWLDEYTNLLANKKSKHDRGVEAEMGRRFYTVVNSAVKNTGANMIAGNMSSALTNFIPLTQANAYVGTKRLVQAQIETLQNMKSSDGLAERSAFLTNRRGTKNLVQTWIEKGSEITGIPMEFVDHITSETIVRARFHQNVEQGMSEEAALEEADAFASRIMAGRSKGDMPTFFGSKNPLLKIFTQFQLEVNNQFSDVFKDMPREFADKTKRSYVAALFRYFLGAWFLNDLYERLYGRRPALDPVDLVNEFVGDLTGYKVSNIPGELLDLLWQGDPVEIIEKVEKKHVSTAVDNLSVETAKQLPFIGNLLGGGRLPAANALPSVSGMLNTLSKDGMSAKDKTKSVAGDLLEWGAYTVLPFGGNQIKKMVQAGQTIFEGGAYKTNSQSEKLLQYPYFKDEGVQSVGNATRALIFGKSSLPQSREWVESEFNTLSADETQGYLDAISTGESQRNVYETILAIKNVEAENTSAKHVERLRVLNSSNLSSEAKFALFKNVLATSTDEKLIEKLYSAGVDENNVIKYVLGVNEIERELDDDGKYKAVSDVQKWRVIVDGNNTSSEKLKLLKEVSTETQYVNFELCEKHRVPLEAYVTLRERLSEFDADENERYSNAEIKTAIDSVFTTVENFALSSAQLTREQKAVLWQLTTGSTSANSNPFGSYKIANEIVEAKKQKKDKSNK